MLTSRIQRFLTFSHRCLTLPAFICLMALLSIGPVTPAQDKSGENAAFYDAQIKPILQANCFRCHGGEAKVKGGLNLTARAGLLKGGSSGPAIDLQEPERSRLVRAIRGQDEDVSAMPPGKKLTQGQIELLTK